jgi:hypothetical protein
MLSMETKTQQAPGNAQVIPNQNNPAGQGTIHSKRSVAHFIMFAWMAIIYCIKCSDNVLYFIELASTYL